MYFLPHMVLLLQVKLDLPDLMPQLLLEKDIFLVQPFVIGSRVH
jgi:hypothetical protein